MSGVKYILGIIAFTLILTACSKEVGFVQEHPNVVKIESELISTKAMPQQYGFASPGYMLDFGVYAYHNGTTLYMGDALAGVLVKRVDELSDWAYTPELFWPGSGSVDFYGYAPTDDGRRNAVKGVDDSYSIRSRTIISGIPPTIDFIVDGYAEYQIDLLLAVPQKGRNREQGVVKMPFKHALTKITFSARIDKLLAAGGVGVKVNEVILSGVYTRGTRSMDATQEWRVYTDDNYRRQFYLERIPTLEHPKPELNDIVLTSDYQNITTPAGVMYMLPQAMTPEMKITVKYSVTTGSITESFVIELPLKNASPDWKQGDAINYLLLIKTGEVILTVSGLPGSPAPSTP